ncbi:hypothetical protein BDY21DRAFT_288340 [Lineolata rhizophorae]|uniref:Endoplasmic reticulum protein n=1 Tax=Lineolata rhizophorae TaxID=578093 RepID=A0A6A6NWD2_9PEZI|nr:hypothetical protein BDY21DRAFT_288340 [Lineolata rhizophorae]
MAPPPPNQPLQQRLMQLATTLQFGWFAGHVMLLLCTVMYGFTYLKRNTGGYVGSGTYRIAFISAAATYGIVVYKAFRARARQGKPNTPFVIATDENVQYLGMALVWLFSRQVPLAILPFAVYSVFHVATYTRGNLLPTIQPAGPTSPGGSKPKPSGASEAIGRFVKEHYDRSMTIVAFLEIGLWFRLLGSGLLFQKGSWILLLVYSAFFRARYAQSAFVRHAVAIMGQRVDALVANQSTPPAVRSGWESFKGLAQQVVIATDVGRYASGAQGAPKKAQ